jgi:Rieske 2Fe-2S family protein
VKQADGAKHGALLPGLEREAYVDQAVFERELERIFERSWICVARSDELEEPGRYVLARAGRESVVVLRNQDGSVRAFVNLCRHRGARLLDEVAGRLGRSIRCPYHAWTYGLDGRLLAAPNMREMPDVDRVACGLHRLLAEEWAGYVWVNASPGEGGAACRPGREAGGGGAGGGPGRSGWTSGTLASQIQPQLTERLGNASVFEQYQLTELGLAHREVYELAANWKSVIENFMECYHCGTIHPELTALLPEFASGYGTVSGGVGRGAQLAAGAEAFARSWRGAHPPLPGLDEERLRLFYGLILRPNVLVILVPDHVAFFRLEPIAVDHTRVVVDWLFPRDLLARPGFDAGDSVAILDLTNRQDFAACERCQLGARSPRFATQLVPAEQVLVGFHRWREQLVGEVDAEGR